MIRIDRGGNIVLARIWPASGRLELWSSFEHSVPASFTGKLDNLGNDRLIEVAVYDQRAVLAIDHTPCIELQLPLANGTSLPNPRPVSFSAHEVVARFSEIQIFRDVYYLDPRGANSDWSLPRPLKPDEYFVLGDNAAISIDSRQWADSDAVRRESIVGRISKRNQTLEVSRAR